MTAPIMVDDSVSVDGAVWAQALSGTPADCVKFGIKRLKKEQDIDIDIVFSGIITAEISEAMYFTQELYQQL